MDMTMPLVKVRPKRQITLPLDVSRKVGIEEGDLVEISVEVDHLTIRPKEIIDKKQKTASLRDLIGSAKGMYGKTSEEADQCLNDIRNEWD